jgi:hydrogenase-4 component B
LINLFLLIIISAGIGILFAEPKAKGVLALIAVCLNSILSGYIAIPALRGHIFEYLLTGSISFGSVLVRIDALSAWFILVINFTIITGAIYGISYMKQYSSERNNLSMHWVSFVLVHASLIGICAVQNGMVFIACWEVLALSAFSLVIFEHYKKETLDAGINYLVQSHISLVFLMIAFIYVAYKTHRFDFDAIAGFAQHDSQMAATVLFLCFFIGFAFKAGFVPFHTWLPYAHPAAPSHVSAIMSGVIIKIGIYGILRMILLIKADYSTIGYIILFISLLSGVYGVMLAIIQHDLKRLLAYHSIENIGIIGIGIGVGCIGLGSSNKWMAILGFSGALLHTLNHSLFKSLLFYSAGNVKQVFHSMNIEQLGGIVKKMPHTSLLFLIAALAICGLPPLNGFISEFIIYGGIYNWLYSANIVSLIILLFSLLGLVMIGGLALLCFTKAFGIVFLGNPRHETDHIVQEVGFWQLLPMYLVGMFIIFIGLFPFVFLKFLEVPLRLFTSGMVFDMTLIRVGVLDSLQTINWVVAGFILLIGLLVFIRFVVNRKRKIPDSATWGCAYANNSPKLQYTATSFVKSYAKLAKPVLQIDKKEFEITEVFPEKKEYLTEPYDKIESVFVDKLIHSIEMVFSRVTFIHSGHLQRYILYGILFITLIICIPLIVEKASTVFYFLNNF